MSRTRSLSRTRTLSSIAAVIVAALLGGCAVTEPETAAPTSSEPEATETTAAPPSPEWLETAARVANVQSASIQVHAAPEGAVTHEFTNPSPSGIPLVFLVEDEEEAADGWLKVQVPVRPNGTVGWVRADQVLVSMLRYSLEVSSGERTLTLLYDGEAVERFPVAVGTGGTPTPTGSFYLVELIAPSNPGYGPFAFGLSAYSDVLNSFGGGPGQIGLHGTSAADSIGTAASHGCIRMHNEDITRLAELLPLGTPITIT